MQDQQNAYAQSLAYPIASEASVDARAEFIKKTYLHLFGAVLVFVGLEAALMQMPGIMGMADTMVGGNGWNWLIVLAVFMVVSGIARGMAHSTTSVAVQYAGLAFYVLLQALIFVPLIAYARLAETQYELNIILPAGVATAAIFTVLTMIVFITRKDFSFLRSALILGGIIAFGLIIASIAFNFELGMIFTVAMIGLISLFVLYDTSNVLHHYNTNQHVAASLALFASVAILLWYVIRLVWILNRE